MAAITNLSGVLLLSLGYYFGSRLGFALTFDPSPVSILWPPNSILMAALILKPVRKWWIYLLAVLPAHFLVQADSQVPLPMMVCWFISNSFEAVVGAAGTRVLIKGEIRFDSLQSLCGFLMFGAFLAPFLSSFVDAGFVLANRWGRESFWEVWRSRFSSNMLSAVIFVPVIVSTAHLRDRWWTGSRLRMAEALALGFALVVICATVFLGILINPGFHPALLYAPVPILLWAALRFGVGETSVAILVVSVCTIWGAAHGRGPFVGGTTKENAAAVQIFLTGFSVTLLTLSVIMQERRKATCDLMVAQKRYKEVVDRQTDLICRYREDTTLTFVNDACCRFFRLPSQGLLGKRLADFLTTDQRVYLLQLTQQDLNLVRHEPHQFKFLTADGRGVLLRWSSCGIISPEGDIAEVQATGHDLTEEKRIEELNQTLAHTSRLASVGELTAMISHEFRQPLTTIQSNVDAAELLLEQDKLSLEALREIFAAVRAANSRASQTISRIRQLLTKKKTATTLDLNSIVHDVVSLTLADARQRRIEIYCDLQELPPIHVDQVQLQQVLLNLLLNAIDAFAGEFCVQRSVRVQTRLLADDLIEMSVKDTGPGIPEERLGTIFESFYTTKDNGMGLGLAIARSFVEGNGGRIWAENDSTGGAVFRVVFPRSALESEGQRLTPDADLVDTRTVETESPLLADYQWRSYERGP